MIGSRCYIGPGVTIGDGAVIAPGSIVTKDVGPYEVWAGAPARKIAHRTKGIPEMWRKQYQELLETYGLKGAEYPYSDEEVRQAAAAGIDRAAQERDRILKELGLAENENEGLF